MSVSFCLPHPVAVSAFMICRGLCACTEMLWMYALYVRFGSKLRGYHTMFFLFFILHAIMSFIYLLYYYITN